jgi:hypothetical protein
MGLGLPYLVLAILSLLLMIWPSVMRVRNTIAWALKDLVDPEDPRAAKKLKRCPGCTEMIQQESRICCFCEYHFDMQQESPRGRSRPPEA